MNSNYYSSSAFCQHAMNHQSSSSSSRSGPYHVRINLNVTGNHKQQGALNSRVIDNNNNNISEWKSSSFRSNAVTAEPQQSYSWREPSRVIPITIVNSQTGANSQTSSSSYNNKPRTFINIIDNRKKAVSTTGTTTASSAAKSYSYHFDPPTTTTTTTTNLTRNNSAFSPYRSLQQLWSVNNNNSDTTKGGSHSRSDNYSSYNFQSSNQYQERMSSNDWSCKMVDANHQTEYAENRIDNIQESLATNVDGTNASEKGWKIIGNASIGRQNYVLLREILTIAERKMNNDEHQHYPRTKRHVSSLDLSESDARRATNRTFSWNRRYQSEESDHHESYDGS